MACRFWVHPAFILLAMCGLERHATGTRTHMTSRTKSDCGVLLVTSKFASVARPACTSVARRAVAHASNTRQQFLPPRRRVDARALLAVSTQFIPAHFPRRGEWRNRGDALLPIPTLCQGEERAPTVSAIKIISYSDGTHLLPPLPNMKEQRSSVLLPCKFHRA